MVCAMFVTGIKISLRKKEKINRLFEISLSETHLVNVKSSQLLDHMPGTEQVPKILLNVGFLNITCQHHLETIW